MQGGAEAVGVLTFVGIEVGFAGTVVGEYEYSGGCTDAEENIEKIKKPISRKPTIVEKTQKGDGLGAICTGGFFIPAVKIKRSKLFKRIKGVTINEVTPHQPKSIVFPVKFQK
jgi:hypothetical protein